MWSYYGAKTNIVHLYPPPKYGKIIEPFAGTARYSLKYWDREVLLLDKYDVIIKIWKWLQKCSPGDLKRLPKMRQGDKIDDFKFDCEESKLLMRFLIGFSTPTPRNVATRRLSDRPNWLNYSINRMAENLNKIRHWQIIEGCYSLISNEEATWFIDPPYKIGGEAYKHNNKSIDFDELSVWCKLRMGQVIVCESAKSNWLPFMPLSSQKVRTGMQHEVFWTNEPTSYGVKQPELFI